MEAFTCKNDIPDSNQVQSTSIPLSVNRPWATSTRSSSFMNMDMLLIWVLKAWWPHRMNNSAISNPAAWSSSRCSTTATPPLHRHRIDLRIPLSDSYTVGLLSGGMPWSRIPTPQSPPGCPPGSCPTPLPTLPRTKLCCRSTHSFSRILPLKGLSHEIETSWNLCC